MRTLTEAALRLVTRGAAARFDASTLDPYGSQLSKLRRIVDRNRDTEYGREHGFAGIRDFAAWRRAVPIVDYEAIRERVGRMARGEHGVLTAEDPVMFAQTSGTTGEPKLIPVTKTCLGRDHSDTMRTWIHHANEAHPGMYRGRILSLVSPAVEGHTESGVAFGATSGHIYQGMSWFVRRLYAIPYDVFTIAHYPTKYYVILRIALDSDVSLICTANPSSIVKICEVADDRSEDLIRDIRDGTICEELLELSGEERDVLEAVRAGLEPHPERAAALERARERRDGRLLPADYWPNLALAGCWKGGTVTTALESLGEWLAAPELEGERSPIAVRDMGYLSSEARGSVPLSDDGAGGVLTVGTNVYEFVAVQDLEASPEDSGSWEVLDVSELQTGCEYYVIVTTSGGLYRYNMNDVIAVTGRYQGTPIIEFRRKGRDVTNITGEKVTANQVIEAFAASSRGIRPHLEHFKAEADAEEARYAFKIECTKRLSDASKHELLAALDQRLSELNVEYAAKRKSERLHAPVLLVMRRGWHDEIKKGDRRDFQRKGVQLSPADTADADFVLERVALEPAERER